MKRSRTAIVTISLLGFFTGLAQDSAYAQNQSLGAACSLEGPSIPDTLKYINDARPDNERISFNEESLVFTSELYMTRETAAIYLLDCQMIKGSVSGDGFTIKLPCRAAMCFKIQGRKYDDQGEFSYYLVSLRDFSFMDFKCDDEKGQRLVRAFRHLIALLQQQYKQSHSDPSDPFAKPPQ